MKINRNPLSVALGAFLSTERQRISLDMKSGKLAQKLEIGESLYRMIESGNARIHPKNFLKFINVFEASRIEHGAFCRLLIAIQFLDSFLDSTRDFQKAVMQLKTNGERYSELLNSLQPLIDSAINDNDDFKDVLQSGIIVDSVREFLSQPDTSSRETTEIQQETITDIFKEIPTIYYSFIDKTIQDLMTLPLGFRSDDLWKWEKNHKEEFKHLYAIVKNTKAIISEKNFTRYKYEYLWSPNFRKAHIIFLGKHNEKELHNDFSKLLKKALEASGADHLLPDFDASLKKLIIHTVDLSRNEIAEIFSDVDPDDQTKSTVYDMAWLFELQRNINVGLKAKIIQQDSKLQEGISLTWNKTSGLYKKLKEIISEK